jgi:peptidoglycan/xylan/chitin deacetylase (PgdA/CDA1 family)
MRTGAHRRLAKGWGYVRRLVRPLLAFSFLFMLFSVAACTVVSLATAAMKDGFPETSSTALYALTPSDDSASDPGDVAAAAVGKPAAAPVARQAPALRLQSPTGSAPGNSTHEWPEPYFPPSSSAPDGDVAALPLIHFQPRYPAVSAVPTWGQTFDGVVNGVSTGESVVALTIDDGPSENTHQVIDEIASFGDRATFFWVGARITSESAVYALSKGDELANHTWNHPNMALLNSAEASAEIGLTSARIAQFTGAPPVWFRSPFNRLFAPELQQIQGHGLLYANYDISSADWIESMSEADIVNKVASELKPGGVILMHDSPGRPPKALHAVLKMLHDRGYSVVTLSQLAQQGDPVQAPLRLGTQGLSW